VSRFWKIIVGLAAVLPVLAFLGGSMVAAQSDLPEDRAPIVVPTDPQVDPDALAEQQRLAQERAERRRLERERAERRERREQRERAERREDRREDARRGDDRDDDDEPEVVRPEPDTIDDDDTDDTDDSDDD